MLLLEQVAGLVLKIFAHSYGIDVTIIEIYVLNLVNYFKRKGSSDTLPLFQLLKI